MARVKKFFTAMFESDLKYYTEHAADCDQRARTFFYWFILANEDLNQVSRKPFSQIQVESAKEFFSLEPNQIFSSFLPKTTEDILERIVRRCYQTEDENESDKLFDYLISIDFYDSKGEKILEEAIRIATGRKVRAERLLRQVSILYVKLCEKRKNQDHRTIEILFNGWRKQLGAKEVIPYNEHHPADSRILKSGV